MRPTRVRWRSRREASALDPEVDLQPESAQLHTTLAALTSACYRVNERLLERFFNHVQSHHWASMGRAPA